jgi:hypothetical protein
MASFGFILAALQIFVITSLTFLSGLAFCLGFWAIPIILRPWKISKSQIGQFEELITRGQNYLQPSSRFLSAALIALGAVTYYYPDPRVASAWTYHLASGLILVQTAWYEIYFVFPVNDKIIAMRSIPGGEDGAALPEEQQMRLAQLMLEWRKWHWGRVIMPLASALVAFVGIM